jgi:O-antigen/teichoic acid export membrane protein
MPSDTKTVAQPDGRTHVLVKAAKNTTANLARLGASWVVVLIVPPLLVRSLDRATYAVWVLVLQMAAYTSLFDNGIQMATARFVARAEEMGDAAEAGRILSNATALLAGAGVLLCAIAAVVAGNLGTIFRSIPGDLVGPAAAALMILGGSLAGSLVFSALGGLYLGQQRNEVNAIAGIASKVLGAAGSAWAAFRHEGLVAMALWMAAGNMVQPVVFLLAERWVKLRSLFRIGLVERETLRRFVRFTSATMASQFGSVIISGLDMPIVVTFDFHAAAYYAVATILSNMLIMPHSAMLSTLMPIASGLSVGSAPERLGEVLIKVTRYSTAVLCAMGVPLMLGMGLFLRMWVGQDYASHALPMAELLVGAQFIRLMLAPYAMIGFSAGQQHRMLMSPMVEALVNLAASLWLVRIWGAMGVAAGTLLGALVGVLLHFVVSMPKTDAISVSRMRLIGSGIVRPLACALPAACVFAIARKMTGVVAEAGLLLAAEGLLLTALWRFNFDAAERAELTSTACHFLRLRSAAG